MKPSKKNAYLESLVSLELQDKYRQLFEKQAQFIDGADADHYKWAGLTDSDTRRLFLRGIAAIEGLEPTVLVNCVRHYGGFSQHNWTLSWLNHSFYLGQDVKFCKRVLGQDTLTVVEAIGTDTLDKEGCKLLGRYIVDKLDLTPESIVKLESWGLCAE